MRFLALFTIQKEVFKVYPVFEKDCSCQKVTVKVTKKCKKSHKKLQSYSHLGTVFVKNRRHVQILCTVNMTCTVKHIFIVTSSFFPLGTAPPIFIESSISMHIWNN